MALRFSPEAVKNETNIVLVLCLVICTIVLYSCARTLRRLAEEQQWHPLFILRGRIVILTAVLSLLTAANSVVAYAGMYWGC